MVKDREDRYLMRQRGAGTHKIKDVDFGLAFPLPSKSQLAPRLSTASSRSSRTSLPGQPSKSLLDSDQVSPEATLRRQRSDSAIGDRRESIATSQGSVGKGSSTRSRRPPGSSALRKSITADETSTHQETPSNNALENEAGEDGGSGDEEDMPSSVAADTPTSRLVLKRKRASSPVEHSRISINKRQSQPPGSSMVDELEGPNPGLFMTPGNEGRTAQLESRSSGTRFTSGRNRGQFQTPTGQITVQPGSIPAVGAIDAHEDELEGADLHESIHSGDAPQDSLGIAQAEDEEFDELAGEAQLAEEEEVEETHEQDADPPTTIPPEQTIPNVERKRKPATRAPSKRSQSRAASSLRQQAARNIRRSKGAQVLVYRLANTQQDSSSNANRENEGGGGEEEEGEDILSTAPKFIRRPGVNAVDVLNQLCKELIETHIQTLLERSMDQEIGPTQRSQLRQHRKAIEGFGQELEDRCFELTEALDTNHALHIRVRQANREKFTLREELLRLRRERESIGLKIDRVKGSMDQKGEKARHENEIYTTMHDIEIAVQRGLARQNQRRQHPTPTITTTTIAETNTSGPLFPQNHNPDQEGGGVLLLPSANNNASLEILLRRLQLHSHPAKDKTGDGDRDDLERPTAAPAGGEGEGEGGLLNQIKSFNGFLESVVGILSSSSSFGRESES